MFASTDPDRPPAYGPDDASVVVLVFSDFQCPVCRRAAEATHQIAEEFPGEVRVEFWQRTSPSHRNAENAAVAALAAHRQGRFWGYHDELFRNQRALDPTSLVRYAEEIGLDVEAFERDYADPELRARVRAENADAEAFGARGTPAFMINGITSVGWGSWNTIRATVNREVEAARQLKAEGRRSEAIAAERADARIDDPGRLARYRERVLVTRGEATGD